MLLAGLGVRMAANRGLGGWAAVCQMTVTSDLAENLTQAGGLVQQAAAQGAAMVFLPEAADFIGESREQTGSLSQDLGGSTVTAFRDLARQHGVWLSLGGLHVKEGEDSRISNTHVVMDAEGEIKASYCKTHLFDVSIPGKVNLKESDYVKPGETMAAPIDTPLGSLGLGICYDLRFAEHSQALALAGAQLLTFPSAFTVPTGLAHWEPLLRARAIETQCYVVAAAQVGSHNVKRTSYGHAMIVDPWGAVVAQCRDGVGIAMAHIDLGYLASVRQNMPVQRQRRADLYGKVVIQKCSDLVTEELELPQDDFVFNFGPAKVRGSSIFYQSSLALAFVNKKPVVPGHVLVVSRRAASKLEDLDQKEITELFSTVQKVEMFLQRYYGVDSSTISIQNGALAGQTIPHVHVHILPRRPQDFAQNDDVYSELQSHDKQLGGWREEDTMAEEAAQLRKAWGELMVM